MLCIDKALGVKFCRDVLPFKNIYSGILWKQICMNSFKAFFLKFVFQGICFSLPLLLPILGIVTIASSQQPRQYVGRRNDGQAFPVKSLDTSTESVACTFRNLVYR